MNTYIQLIIQFFNIGLFSFGGGYSTLPFLYKIAENYHWYTTKQLTDMLAVSSITPGPIGVNVSTFAGFTTNGILGAFLATSALVLPSIIIVSIVYKILDKFKSNRIVTGAVKALKPAGCGLLAAVGIKLLFTSNLNILGTILLMILICSTFWKKFDPIIYLSTTALIGVILGYYNLIGV